MEGREALQASRIRFLTFVLGPETYGIDIGRVNEIESSENVLVMPEQSDRIKGVLALHGTLIPVLDTRRCFGKEANIFVDKSSVIVTRAGDIAVGLLVDKVSGLLTIDENDLLLLPDVNASAEYSYIKGIGYSGKQIVILLEIDNLLKKDDIACIRDILG